MEIRDRLADGRTPEAWRDSRRFRSPNLPPEFALIVVLD
jgi:hypothetical protein